ncbi:MAG: phage tail protein I [Janthinobacterium lividum]
MANNALLPPNATRHERNLAHVAARITDIPSPLADSMNPDKIARSQLPWLAWHLGVDAWQDYWPDQVKRARIKAAIPIARKKGTAAAVREVVATFGANLALREWFETTPPGIPGTFEIVMTVSARNSQPPTAEYVADIVASIDRTKPVRAHYTVTQGFSAQGRQCVAAAAQCAVYRRLSLSES